MNLRVWSLQSAIEELARAKGLTAFRVDYTVNAGREIIIALTLPPTDDDEPGPSDATGRVRAKHLR